MFWGVGGFLLWLIDAVAFVVGIGCFPVGFDFAVNCE